MRCEGIDHGCVDWDYEKEEKIGQWNGKMIQPLDADLTVQCIYQDATKMSSNTTARVYLVEDTHGNDSFNPPSSEANSEPNCGVDLFVNHDKDNTHVGVEGNYSKEFKNENGKSVAEMDITIRGEVNNKGDGKVEFRGGVRW